MLDRDPEHFIENQWAYNATAVLLLIIGLSMAFAFLWV